MAGAVIPLLAIGVFLAGGGSGSGSAPLAERKNPLLPDLAMAPIEYADGSFGGADGTSGNRPYLRFGATIQNLGAGDFMLAGRRSWPVSDDWAVTQRIAEAGGGFTERATGAGMIWGGDRHDHWHVRAVEAHRLERVDTGEVVAEVVKQGFCFFDVDVVKPPMAGAPEKARWLETACDGRFSTSLTVGLSVGWADIYPPDMVEQHMELTGIPDGRYRIREIADPFNWFDELDETNNETWVEVDISTVGGFARVTLVPGSQGPASPTPSQAP